MKISKTNAFPDYSLPTYLDERPIDILSVGSSILEQVVHIDDWPEWGKQATFPVHEIKYSTGGCATNVACFAGRMGGKVSLVTVIGDGGFGQAVLKEVIRSGVDARFVKEMPNKEGNLVIEFTNADGEWMVMDYIDPIVRLTQGCIPPLDVFKKAKILHIDGFSFVSAGSPEVIDQFLERGNQAGCVISSDGSVPAAKSDPEYLRSLYERSHIVSANLEEALAATKTHDLSEAIKIFQKMGPHISTIKLGKKGSYLVTSHTITQIPAFPVKVIDTVGAGDAYNAALLLSLCQKKPLRVASLRGSAAGAFACKGAGSLTSHFTLIEVDSFIQANLGGQNHDE